MYKEMAISIIVVLVVIIIDFSLGKYIDTKFNHIIDLLDDIREAVKTDDFDKANELKKELNDYWNKNKTQLSCYVEHDELEKVETEFTSFKSCLEMRKDDSLEYIDRMMFVIKHIEEKDDLILENIF